MLKSHTKAQHGSSAQHQACFQRAEQPVWLTFTHGLIVGQISLMLVIGILVKYLLCEDPQSAKAPKKHKNPSCGTLGPKTSKRRRSFKAQEPELLLKLSYDLSSHPPETTDWLNVLIAQAMVAYRSLAHGVFNDTTHTKGSNAKAIVEEALNFARGDTPGVVSVDHITVTEVDFGGEYPVCTNARVRPADESGRMVLGFYFNFF